METLKLNFKLAPKLFLVILLVANTLLMAQDAESLYNDGLDKVKRLKKVEAKLLFSQAIEKDPKHAKSFYQRGLISKHFNEIDAALSDFKKVTFLEKEFKTEAHFEIGLIKVSQEDYKGSVIDFSIVLNTDSTNAKAFYLRGISNKLSKQYEVALLDFKSAIKYDSTNIDAYFQKGVVEVETEKYDEAIASLSKAIEKDPKHAQAFFYRAIAEYEEASSKAYDHKRAHLHKALADFNACLAIDDKIEPAYFDRGEVKMELKDYIGAIADFKKAIELKPTDLEAHYLKALCNYHYGYEDIAYKEMKDIVNIDSMYADARYFIAEYLYEKQKYKEALVEFDKLFQIETPHADAYVFRGYTKYELGDRVGACTDWKEAQKMGDKEAEHDVKKYCK